jgi:hypothetical protein
MFSKDDILSFFYDLLIFFAAVHLLKQNIDTVIILC